MASAAAAKKWPRLSQCGSWPFPTTSYFLADALVMALGDERARAAAGAAAIDRRRLGNELADALESYLSTVDAQGMADLLMAVAASLKAGHSFKQGIQTLVEEAQDPAKKEFQRVLAEASLGRPIEAALADMAERLGSKNFSFIVTAVSIQNQVGGSLAGLFNMVADTVRQRQQFSRKIRALTAMGRASVM